MVNKLVDTPNPTLVTLRDNKAKWNLPEYRRTGYRNCLLYTSDAADDMRV